MFDQIRIPCAVIPPPLPPHWSLDWRPFATAILTYDVWNCQCFCMLVPDFTAGWKTNQFYLAGREISCVSCWEKGTDNFFPAILNNTCHALIVFIKHFSTNWWFGAPSYRLYRFYQSAKAENFCQIHFIRLNRRIVGPLSKCLRRRRAIRLIDLWLLIYLSKKRNKLKTHWKCIRRKICQTEHAANTTWCCWRLCPPFAWVELRHCLVVSWYDKPLCVCLFRKKEISHSKITSESSCMFKTASVIIAKQGIFLYTRGPHCQIIIVMQHQALYNHDTSCKPYTNVFSVRIDHESYWYFVRGCTWFCVVSGGFGCVFGGFRWFWMILAGFGWFHVLVTTLKGNIEVTWPVRLTPLEESND